MAKYKLDNNWEDFYNFQIQVYTSELYTGTYLMYCYLATRSSNKPSNKLLVHQEAITFPKCWHAQVTNVLDVILFVQRCSMNVSEFRHSHTCEWFLGGCRSFFLYWRSCLLLGWSGFDFFWFFLNGWFDCWWFDCWWFDCWGFGLLKQELLHLNLKDALAISHIKSGKKITPLPHPWI